MAPGSIPPAGSPGATQRAAHGLAALLLWARQTQLHQIPLLQAAPRSRARQRLPRGGPPQATRPRDELLREQRHGPPQLPAGSANQPGCRRGKRHFRAQGPFSPSAKPTAPDPTPW